MFKHHENEGLFCIEYLKHYIFNFGLVLKYKGSNQN
jgi:hypothetical protein